MQSPTQHVWAEPGILHFFAAPQDTGTAGDHPWCSTAKQGLSECHVGQNHMEDSLKHGFLGSPSRISDSVAVMRDLRICISASSQMMLMLLALVLRLRTASLNGDGMIRFWKV